MTTGDADSERLRVRWRPALIVSVVLTLLGLLIVVVSLSAPIVGGSALRAAPTTAPTSAAGTSGALSSPSAIPTTRASDVSTTTVTFTSEETVTMWLSLQGGSSDNSHSNDALITAISGIIVALIGATSTVLVATRRPAPAHRGR